MPEGHTIHRAARDHHRIFAGKQLSISSPQGRFAKGAALLSGQQCSCVEAFGKHLIYHFDHSDVLHIHLGLFGRIRKHKLPETEPKGAVRIRLVGDTHVIDINGPTICQILPRQEFLRLINRIGPDVLRSDANPDLVFNRISKSKAPIGRLIMDQSVMAGIGNIYRSEILWRQSIHPETPGNAIGRDMFDRIWNDAKELLAIGVKHNAIITTNTTPPAKSRYRERVNIFAKTICPTCKGMIRRFEISGRRAYLCETCQPLPG
ncbi:MAG: Fpg/Nei family DNA glycosylase [Candidatus Puniceispirillum sp.]|nr:Fpg/Nei family DNA glycosylase [Candidatus Puniceispirillum sp.]